jgi:hypothetical protein
MPFSDYAGGSIEEEEPIQPVTWAERVPSEEPDLEDGVESNAGSDADD